MSEYRPDFLIHLTLDRQWMRCQILSKDVKDEPGTWTLVKPSILYKSGEYDSLEALLADLEDQFPDLRGSVNR